MASKKDEDLGATLRQHQKQQVKSEAKVLKDLEKAREKLFEVIAAYRKELTSKTLPENRTQRDKDNRAQLMSAMNEASGDLNIHSLGEGTLTGAIAALNCILLLKDEINTLAFQNYGLSKQISELKQEIALLKRVEKESVDTK